MLIGIKIKAKILGKDKKKKVLYNVLKFLEKILQTLSIDTVRNRTILKQFF